MKFSIITINYNNCDGLKRTINSIISQTFSEYEFIVIDGGSADGSLEVIKEYQQHISYWVSEKDDGIYAAMNKGIRKATGDYINFMNSGDIFYDKNVLSEIAKEKCDDDIIVGKDYYYDPISKKGFSPILPTRISMVTFFKETLPHQGAFIKRVLFENSLYNEDFRICSDWAFYTKKIVFDNCRVKLTPIIVSQREQGGISNTLPQKQKEEREAFLHSILPIGVYRDYETLANLDRLTLYKLMNICEHKKACKLLTLCIKFINHLYL